MRRLGFLFSVFISINISCVHQQETGYERVKAAFLNPPSDSRPKVYWWCLNGNIDTLRVKEEFRAMRETGITGFDFFEIGVSPQDSMIPAGPAFLGDESLKTIKFVMDEAGRQGLKAGFNVASSWNAGGSWINPEHAGKSLYVAELKVKGGQEERNIRLPFPEISFPKESLVGGTGKPMIPFRENGKPVYYEEVAVLALPATPVRNSLDTSQVIDLTPYFDPATELLKWDAPKGEWRICRYVCSNSGQQVVRPSPLSAGLTIDHFDSTAVETHLMYVIERLRSVLGDFRKTALQSFYLASYEARGFVWSSTLPAAFRKVNGYYIRKYLPTFFEQDLFRREATLRVKRDFSKTLSEMMINNLYRKSKEICNRYGLKINSEAGGPGYPLYNGPAEPLKAQGSLDIPRGEFWINHPRYYTDTNGKDSIDILRVVKEVAAASHIYKKGEAEEEAFTSFQHWQEGPFDMKPLGDRAFCEGMNRAVIHGFSHNITGSGFPGYVYHAGTHFNDKRVWWTKAKPFVDYLSRISAVFRESNFVADVVWYYGDKIPNSATPKNTHFKVGPGYDYEVINTDILLNDLSMRNGKLVLSNGAEFSLLVLENEEEIHPAVLKKLEELTQQGAVIAGEKPRSSMELLTFPMDRQSGEDLINRLWAKAENPPELTGGTKGKILCGIPPADILKAMGVAPDIAYPGSDRNLIDYIHFSKEETDIYFIRNETIDWVSREIGFRQREKNPELWDPVSGEILPSPIFDREEGYVKLPLSLPPYGSLLIVFRTKVPRFHYTRVKGEEANPPLMKYVKEGICFLGEGSVELGKGDKTFRAESVINTSTLEGEWEVTFTKGWGAPEKLTFPELISWTDHSDEGVKYYSGIATYTKTFHYQKPAPSGDKIKVFLDPGEISKVGEVWINGANLGIAWTKSSLFDVTKILKQGENSIKVEVANVWSNRLKGDALTNMNYTNTNIRNTIVPVPTLDPGSQRRVPWAEVPLIKSGLLGPVILKTYRLVPNVP